MYRWRNLDFYINDFVTRDRNVWILKKVRYFNTPGFLGLSKAGVDPGLRA